MSTNLVLKPLFGGAIAAHFPDTFLDASTLREIPDSQEVFVHRTRLTSVIFDILERLEGLQSDDDALRAHVKDVIGGDEVDVVEDVEGCVVERLREFPARRIVVRTKGEKKTVLMVLLVRLVAKKTDVLVCVNVPLEEGKLDELIEEGKELLEGVRRTLEVKDWSLFVEE